MYLSWDANTEIDLSRYWVYRATGSGSVPTSTTTAVHYATVTAPSNSYPDSLSDLEKYYSYWVVAVDTFNTTSAFSARQSAVPDAQGPEITHMDLTQRSLGRDKILVEYDITENCQYHRNIPRYRWSGKFYFCYSGIRSC
jgi:fibronectin type 3 domain-containing protein